MHMTTMPITKARVNLGAVVKRVLKGERITLEKGGIPVVTIISREDLEDLEDGIALMMAREQHKGEKGIPWDKLRKQYGL